MVKTIKIFQISKSKKFKDINLIKTTKNQNSNNSFLINASFNEIQPPIMFFPNLQGDNFDKKIINITFSSNSFFKINNYESSILPNDFYIQSIQEHKYCNKSCSRKDNLKRHIDNHHSDYSGEICLYCCKKIKRIKEHKKICELRLHKSKIISKRFKAHKKIENILIIIVKYQMMQLIMEIMKEKQIFHYMK